MGDTDTIVFGRQSLSDSSASHVGVQSVTDPIATDAAPTFSGGFLLAGSSIQGPHGSDNADDQLLKSAMIQTYVQMRGPDMGYTPGLELEDMTKNPQQLSSKGKCIPPHPLRPHGKKNIVKYVIYA